MKREYKIALSQEYYSDVVYLSQYDTDYDIEFTVLDKYAKATGIDGYTAKFTGTRCDGLGFTFESTADGETVAFEINTSLTAISGTHKGEIVFYDTNGLFFGSANVQIVVEPAARPDGTIDADVERAQEIADQIQEIVDTAAATVNASLGTLSNLTTTDKSSVVAAINEVDANTDTNTTNIATNTTAIGTLANLTTTEKTSLVGAINEVDADVADVKENLSDMVNSAYVTDSASGAVAHFEDGANNVPMKSVKVMLEPSQTGSGVRPISGHSGVVRVYRSGEDTSDASEFSVALNGVVYGGTLDVVSGVLTVDRASVVMDGSSDEGWYVMTTANIFRANAITPTPASGATAEDITQHPALSNRTNVTRYNYNLMKDAYPAISFNEDGRLYLAISADTTTIEQALAWLAQNNLQIVYYLANPQTIQLTPQQVNSLLGVNNVWSDAGDVEVEYRADTKLYIDKRLGV